MSDKIMELQSIIDTYDNIVFFGGAGVSTESNIPDFRSVDGLYHQKYDYPPETILSHTFYCRHTEEFYRFYHDKMLFPDAKPNAAHLALQIMAVSRPELREKLLAARVKMEEDAMKANAEVIAKFQ